LLNFIEIGDDDAFPVTVIDESTGPDVLLRLKLVPMLKMAEAVPPVFVAEIVFAPEGEDGTANVAVKLPRVVEVTVAIVRVLNLTGVATPAAKPLPVTVTDVPTGPDDVLSETLGVTENVEETEPAVFVAITV
jgi:hypothetical protein